MEELIQQTLIENYDRYYRLAFKFVHNEHDAMDVVQEGAYKAILKSDSLKEKAYANTWIYRIMVNEALGFLRANRRETPNSDEQLYDAAVPHQDVYEDEDLRLAIERLNATDKMIIVLRYFEDKKIETIADILGENTNTIKSRLYRTLKKLKLSLE